MRSVSKGGAAGTTGAATFSGLNPNQAYDFIGVVEYLTTDGTSGASSAGATFRTDPVIPTIPHFYWSVAQPEPISSGSPLIVRASAWNAMIGKIEQIRGHLGYGTPHLPTLKVSAGSPISASLYNNVVGQIKALNPGAGVSNVISGTTPLYASRFIAFETAINSIIDNL